MINTVLFDLDGTLLNTLEDITDSVNYMLESMGTGTQKQTDEVRQYLGDGLIHLMERVLPPDTDRQRFKNAMAIYREHYASAKSKKTRPYDGITAMLTKLKEHGISMAVVSNKSDGAVKELVKEYFDGLISTAVGDDFIRPVKPDPASVKYAMARLDAIPSRCIFVGDSEVDVKAAHNCGIRCVAVSWGYRTVKALIESGADKIIERPEELLDIIFESSDKH